MPERFGGNDAANTGFSTTLPGERRGTMKTIVMTCAILFAVAAGTAVAQDAKVKKGMQVFVTQKCSQCHSIAGKGNAKGKMDDVGSKLTPDEMREWITDPVGMAAKNKKDRKPPMKKKALSSDDVDALVAYLSTLK
jgi:mono/diheme cytochrome c family protein